MQGGGIAVVYMLKFLPRISTTQWLYYCYCYYRFPVSKNHVPTLISSRVALYLVGGAVYA